MGKRRRRGKRKEPSGEEIVPGLIILIILLIYLNGASLSDVIWYLALGSAALLIVLAFVWFVRGMVKSIDATDSKPDQFKFKNAQQVNQERSKPPITIPRKESKPAKWTEELIAQLEWRVFEKLCIRLWQEKGFSVKETGSGADGGVDFYLYATATKQKIGAVQCKSWSKRQIDVKVVRELQGVVASEQLKLGLLMYSGKLSKSAEEFIANPAVSVKAQGNKDILKEINKLDAEKQEQLLNELFTEDYQVPSCPKCDVKLVERTAKKTGNTFWGCTNFPRCRFTMRS